MKELQVMQGVEYSGRKGRENASGRKRQRQRKRRMRQLRARLLRAAVILLAVVLVYFVFRGGRFLVQKLTGTVSEDDSGFLGSDGLKGIFGESKPVVILDAGHGGNDQGTSAGKLLEKDINLKVAKLVEKKLKKEGIRVLMTRTDDSRVELSERSGLANDKGAALFVSIHCNYCEGSSKVQGLECYYEEGSDSGQALAELFSRGFDGAAEVTNRGTKSDDFHVLRETKMPAVLIELGYMSNASEKEKLEQKDYQELLAECIAQSVLKSELVSSTAETAHTEDVNGKGVLNCLLAAVLLFVSLSDLKTYTIPLRYSAYIVALGIIKMLLLRGTLMEAAAGILMAGIPLLFLYIVSRGKAIGGGDVKLMMAAGVYLGGKTLTALFIGCLAAVILHPLRRKLRGVSSKVALGPYLSFGILFVALDICAH